MNPPSRTVNLLLLTLLCVLILNTTAQPVSQKNVTNGRKGGEDKTKKGSESIVSPTNIFKDNDGTISSGKSQNNGLDETTKRNLRPFEWLYKHLGEYLMCAYSERNDCEEQLAKNIRREEITTRDSERQNQHPLKFEGPSKYLFGSFPRGRPMDGFQPYPAPYFDGPGPQGFPNQHGGWEHPPQHGHRFDDHRGGFGPGHFQPQLLHFPTMGGDKVRHSELHDRPDRPRFFQPHMTMFQPGFMPFHGESPRNEPQTELLRKTEDKSNRNGESQPAKAPQHRDNYPPMMQYPMLGFPLFLP